MNCADGFNVAFAMGDNLVQLAGLEKRINLRAVNRIVFRNPEDFAELHQGNPVLRVPHQHRVVDALVPWLRLHRVEQPLRENSVHNAALPEEAKIKPGDVVTYYSRHAIEKA